MAKTQIPSFDTVEEESDFWDTHDATDFEAVEVTVQEIVAGLESEQPREIRVALPRGLSQKIVSTAKTRGVSCHTLVRELLERAVQALL